MFTKKELKALDKIIPDKKFMNSKAGMDAAQSGIKQAAKDSDNLFKVRRPFNINIRAFSFCLILAKLFMNLRYYCFR